MSKSTILFFSGRGHITETIAGIFPADFEVIKMYLDEDHLETSTPLFQKADLCVLNLSHITEQSSNTFLAFQQKFPDKHFIIVHHYIQRKFAQEFINMGADAYLHYNFLNDELNKAICSVLKGNTYLSSALE